MHSAKRQLLAVLMVLAGSAVAAPMASATITPTVTLTPSSVTAGSTAALGVDLKFAPSGTDSPKDITLSLPPGLLADASIDNGACLKTAMLSGTTCQVGTGTVTATLIVLGTPTTSLPISVTLYLVPPPAPGDLAGLAIVDPTGTVLGTPGSISVQPPSASLQIAFTNVPDSYAGQSIAIDEISTSFTAMRMPTSCPATPAPLSVTADSYADAAQQTAKAPLTVTDCSKLAYAPTLAVTATKDSADSGVQVQSDVKQAVGEATSSTVNLTLPTGVLAPNPAALGEICTDATFTGCTPVGSSKATSPLYPTPLIGTAYLTGPITALALQIVFPPPFSLTLSGAVDIATNSTTFSGVPDIPLTDLGVTLSGGSGSLFTSDCTTPSGTAKAVLTSQNGDKTASPTSPFTISGCTTRVAVAVVAAAGVAAAAPAEAAPVAAAPAEAAPVAAAPVAAARAAAPAVAARAAAPAVAARAALTPASHAWARRR